MTDRAALDATLRAASEHLGRAIGFSSLGSNTPLPKESVAARLSEVQKLLDKALALLGNHPEDMYAGVIGP